ncbi:helix-turn-helix domain-containing protein [Streptomyces sp. HU2014]|uniref:helix-turn-helix transcriptional regulator n=1 Tax=Streptomyces sp. HU2014 TaxID=2939414 RepID=UPI00200EFBC6|nr:helix-turn-helix domain-containing protein [Streptomyces sp. HU2014]UQI46107.1 helix-turn-helix domain-containing protein [Streptomyces sp. HU2014]
MYQRPDDSHMARHPLKVARESLGLSQLGYARLIARAHDELGFGPRMVRTRHTVSHWEAGRNEPELTAQLAIARVHRVPGEEVARLGWPHWLHLATDDTALLNQPWTPQGAIGALHSTARLAGARPRSYLTVTGPALDFQIKKSLAALASPQPPPTRDGRPVTPGMLAGMEARIEALELQEVATPVTPMALYVAARAEHRLLAGLLTSHGYDAKTGAWLLLLATRTAALCEWLSGCLGEEARAERYALAAIRAATAAGSRRRVASCMIDLAFRHLVAGDPKDMLSLVHAARAIVRRPPAGLAVTLHTREAQALARLGDLTASTRALGRATSTLADEAADADPVADLLCVNVGEEWLAVSSGAAWLHLGRPKKALPHFTTLLDDGPASRTPDPPSPYAARRLLYVVDAQLALGELDAAAHSAHRAVALVGRLPPGLARQFRQRFAHHSTEPVVRDLIEEIRSPDERHPSPLR